MLNTNIKQPLEMPHWALSGTLMMNYHTVTYRKIWISFGKVEATVFQKSTAPLHINGLTQAESTIAETFKQYVILGQLFWLVLWQK